MRLCYDHDAADLHQVLACHPDPGIRREAQSRLYHGYPWSVLEPPAFKLLGSPDVEDRHWANRAFRVAPLPLYQARLQALLAADHPSSRQDAIALLEHNRYRWLPLAKLQPVEFKARLESLAKDTDLEVSRRGRLLLWELGMRPVADLQGLARADMSCIDLAELCLDNGQWDPALETALLDLALQPLEEGPAPEELKTEATPKKAFGRVLPRPRPAEHRLRGIRQLLPALVLASPEDCLRLGRRVLDEAPDALRMAGPILMAMAGEPGFEETLHLAGGGDPSLSRAARIGAASARTPRSRAFLRWLLMAGEGDVRREGGEAMVWRAAWDPCAYAALFQAEFRGTVTPPEDCLDGETPEWFKFMACWQFLQVDGAGLGQAGGLDRWLPAESDLPRAPEDCPGSLRIRHRAMAYLMKSPVASTRLRALMCMGSASDRHKAAFTATFSDLLDDPDHDVRAEAVRPYVQTGGNLDRFLSVEALGGAEFQASLAWAVSIRCQDKRDWAFLEFIARNGCLRAQLNALTALLPSGAAEDRVRWRPVLASALKHKETWGSAVSLLDEAPVRGLGEALAAGFRKFAAEAPPPPPMAPLEMSSAYRSLVQLLDSEWDGLGGFLCEVAGSCDRDLAGYLAVAACEHPVAVALPALQALLGRFPASVVLWRAVGRVATTEAFDLLLDATFADAPAVRRHAVAALGCHPAPEARLRLLELVQDPDARVRARALRSLGWRREGDVANLLWDQLAAPDAKVRRSALFGLLAQPVEVSALLVARAWKDRLIMGQQASAALPIPDLVRMASEGPIER